MGQLAVIIPVVQRDLFAVLYQQMMQNTVVPELVICINNSGSDLSPIFKEWRAESNVTRWWDPDGEEILGVNESWNHGIAMLDKDVQFVSILNDDIKIGPTFFKSMLSAFTLSSIRVGVACPHTLPEIPGQEWSVVEHISVRPMKRREGWAMTFQKSFLDLIPPIPHERIKIFCGDDWYWYWAFRFGYRWVKIVNELIVHECGASVVRLGKKHLLKQEKNEFNRIVAELELQR
jgi:GT2 family glycosyltransferase